VEVGIIEDVERLSFTVVRMVEETVFAITKLVRITIHHHIQLLML